MKVINLGETNSVLNSFIAQMRDKTIQKNHLLFRTNLHRVGEIFAYEISKKLNYSPKDVVTPLATAHMQLCDSKIVVATILRAGLPLHDGVLSFFDGAENAFIAAYRKYEIKIDLSVLQIGKCLINEIAQGIGLNTALGRICDARVFK